MVCLNRKMNTNVKYKEEAVDKKRYRSGHISTQKEIHRKVENIIGNGMIQKFN